MGILILKSYKDFFNLFDFLWVDNSLLMDDDKIKISVWEKCKNMLVIKVLLEDKVSFLFYWVCKKDLGLMFVKFYNLIVVLMNVIECMIYESVSVKIMDFNECDYVKNEEIFS